ncbi:MAG: hypothetical protein JO323_02260 [Acidobacteriia bacterium]|nr:hypothetical protein [Terriglobia bacterium]
MEEVDVQAIVRNAIQEFIDQDRERGAPAYKAELQDERKRREQLERRVNELVDENKRSRKMAEEAERSAAIRSELQKLGVAKVDIAYKAVQDAIQRREDGRLVAQSVDGEVPVKEYLSTFVTENPEFLPARISGGTGMTAMSKSPHGNRDAVDIEKIRPGMNPEDMQRVREEIVRVASQTLRGL